MNETRFQADILTLVFGVSGPLIWPTSVHSETEDRDRLECRQKDPDNQQHLHEDGRQLKQDN